MQKYRTYSNDETAIHCEDVALIITLETAVFQLLILSDGCWNKAGHVLPSWYTVIFLFLSNNMCH